jgi:hypothetical protein
LQYIGFNRLARWAGSNIRKTQMLSDYSEREVKLFEALKMPNLLDLDPSSAYRIAVTNCFVRRKEGPAVEALALAYLSAFMDCRFYRMSPEFEELINLEIKPADTGGCWYIYFTACADTDYSDPDTHETVFRCVKMYVLEKEARTWAEGVKEKVIDYINSQEEYGVYYSPDSVHVEVCSLNRHIEFLTSATQELDDWIQEKEEEEEEEEDDY